MTNLFYPFDKCSLVTYANMHMSSGPLMVSLFECYSCSSIILYPISQFLSLNGLINVRLASGSKMKVLCKVLLNRLNEELDATLRSAQVRLQTLSAIQMTMNAFHIERESDTER